jgi:hypothetical protein
LSNPLDNIIISYILVSIKRKEVNAMAVTENAYRSSVSVKLNGGVNAVSGNTLVKSCSLGKLERGADGDKIMNVVGALLPVLDYPLVRVERTEVTLLEPGE